MTRAVIGIALSSLVALALLGCAQFIGIEDLPPLPEVDAGLPDPGPDATPVDEPALVALSVSGVAPAITLIPGEDQYTVDLPLIQESVTVTATVNAAASGLVINEVPWTSGIPSDPIPLALGSNLIRIDVEGNGEASSVFLIVRRADQIAQYAYSKASNTGADDSFGSSVALSGDTLAVGAYEEASAATGVNGNESDNTANSSGAVYVFRRSGTVWQQEAYIKASNTSAGDYFGSSVALSGDTLAVGASGEASAATGVNGNESDNTANSSGAVYVFRRSGTVWQQEAYIKASNTSAGDYFGWSVALAGDTVAVGAPHEESAATGVNGNEADDSGGFCGAVYVFRRSGTVWQQEAYVKASNTGAGDFFGWDVALSGDTLAVGAWSENSVATGMNGNEADDSAVDSGAVYVFRRSGTVWQQEVYIKASNTDASDAFGYSIALSGESLAVGAIGEGSVATGVNGNEFDDTAFGSGAVYVFRRSGTAWQQEAYIKASNTHSGDRFGASVALSGDTLAVAAPDEPSTTTGVNGNEADNSAVDSGAVYVFRRSGTDWQQQAYVKASNTGSGDYFGSSVALSGDALLVGAAGENSAATGVNGNEADNSAVDSGAVYVFH